MDFNNDCVLDLVVGERDGYYSFYTGNGDGTLHFVGFAFDENGDPLQRNYNSAPYLTDWDEDGYIDFIAGGYDTETVHGGILEVHLNTQDSPTSPVWSATTIDLTPLCDYWRVTHETYDLDMDGDKDLIFGYEMGNVWFAENIGTNSSPEFEGFIQLQCDGGNIDVYNNFSGGGRARENVVDYNNDGIPDLLVGCNNGWIYYFQGYTTGISEESSSSGGDFTLKLSGIPTTGMFSVELTHPATPSVRLTVYDAAGKAVVSTNVSCQGSSGSFDLDITDNPAGMYIMSAVSDDSAVTAKLIKIE